jgi:predicted nucleotidyltransferase
MKRLEVETRTILLALTGSRLYRVHNENSDYDYKGICIPTLPYREITGDSQFIRQIRNGEVPYDTLIAEVSKLEQEMESAMKNTKLPKYPDQKLIEEKQIEIIKEYLNF